jgi:hypothetical protein
MAPHDHRKTNYNKRSLPWPLILAVGGAVLLALAALVVFGQPASAGQTIEVSGGPRLKVDQEAIDFGNIPLGGTVQAQFRLTNIGDRPLQFLETPYIEVKEGC